MVLSWGNSAGLPPPMSILTQFNSCTLPHFPSVPPAARFTGRLQPTLLRLAFSQGFRDLKSPQGRSRAFVQVPFGRGRKARRNTCPDANAAYPTTFPFQGGAEVSGSLHTLHSTFRAGDGWFGAFLSFYRDTSRSRSMC